MKNGKQDARTIEATPDSPERETGAGTRNRTGAATSPEMALDMIRMAQRTPPDPEGDAAQVAEYRKPYIEGRSVLGSGPSPLLDKLGERLAFERQGVRLYECLIGKVKILGPTPGGPSLGDLEHILEEEGKHLRFLQQAIIQSGGDPTLQTPCANVAGVLSQGIVQIVSDPRTTLVQCLEAMLNAELADNEGWTMLRELVDARGANELVDKIEEAGENEQEHLEMVRGWLSALVIGEDWEEADAKGDAPKAAGKTRGGKPSRTLPGKKKGKS